MSFRLPRWLRMAGVVLLLCLMAGVGSKILYESFKPTTLKIAVGSMDGEAVRVTNAISSRMAATKAPVRISVVDKGSPLAAAEAFAAGEADLAVVRADGRDLGSARAIVQLTNLVLVIIVPAGS